MLLNNDIQVQRPNTLHNKIQHTFYFFSTCRREHPTAQRGLVETPTKKKAHSQSNKPTSTAGALKPPSNFDRTIDLYSAALSAEGYWIGFSERFITACLWKGWPVPTDSISASRSSGQSKCMAFNPWLEVEVVVFEVVIQDNRADCIVSFLPKGDHIEYPCRPPQDRFGVSVADGTA